MKENNDLKIKNHTNNKNEKLEQANSKKYIKYSSNIIRNRNYYKTYINKKNSANSIKEKDGIKKLTNAINVKPISNNYNSNNLMKSYSNKKDIYNYNENIDNNDIKTQNISGYKQILDKMIEQYAINENSKENIDNLLKKSIINQKHFLVKKSKVLSPSLKKHFLNKNSIQNKYKYFSGDNRSIKKKNESYLNKVVKLQSFWRGYYLRNIVVRGLKKYYGLIFIYIRLKKYILKKKKNIFEILFENELANNERKSTKYNTINNKLIYSKKLFYNNTLNNSDKNSFSFSTPNDGTIDNISDHKTKTYYSKDKVNTKIKNKYNFPELKNTSKTIDNELTNNVKEINLNQNNINININNDNKNNFSINNFYGTANNLGSSIIKGDNNSKIGRITYNFFNKYEDKDIKPIENNSQYYFRKPIYIKKPNKKYIHVNKNNINKDDKEDNFSSQKSTNSKYDSNNSLNNWNKFKFNSTLYNIYKFVFNKIINLIRKKFYNTYFQSFLYQLKIKRKVGQIKLYHSILLSIILKKDKKIKKKYLDIYREKVLTLKANELLKYEKNNNIYNSEINLKNKNINTNKANNKLKNPKNFNSNINKYNINNKGIILKLLTIKNKYVNKILGKYFCKWKKKPFVMISYNNKKDSNRYSNINKKRNVIIVNKKKIKIKREQNKLNYSQKIDRTYSISKEKKMKIIKRVSKPDEYLLLYNSYSKNLRDSINKCNNNEFLNEEKDMNINKIFYIINKLESKKLLFKFFKYWKKIKK